MCVVCECVVWEQNAGKSKEVEMIDFAPQTTTDILRKNYIFTYYDENAHEFRFDLNQLVEIHTLILFKQ